MNYLGKIFGGSEPSGRKPMQGVGPKDAARGAMPAPVEDDVRSVRSSGTAASKGLSFGKGKMAGPEVFAGLSFKTKETRKEQSDRDSVFSGLRVKAGSVSSKSHGAQDHTSQGSATSQEYMTQPRGLLDMLQAHNDEETASSFSFMQDTDAVDAESAAVEQEEAHDEGDQNAPGDVSDRDDAEDAAPTGSLLSMLNGDSEATPGPYTEPVGDASEDHTAEDGAYRDDAPEIHDSSTAPPISDAVEATSPERMSALERDTRRIRERVGSSTRAFQDALGEHWSCVEQVHRKLLQIKEKEQAYREKKATLADELESKEMEQAAAIEEEMYDRADQLDTEAQRISKLIASSDAALQALAVEREDLIERRSASTTATLESTALFIQHMDGETGDAWATFAKNAEAEAMDIADEEDVLHGQEERLRQVLKHIDSDMDQVLEERHEIDEVIESQTQDVQIAKCELLEEKAELQSALDDLMKLVREKEAEIDVCDAKIAEADDAIGVASKAFERDLRRLHERKENIAREKQLRLEEERDVETRQETLVTRRSALQERESVIQTIRDDMQSLVEASRRTSDRLELYHARHRDLVELEASFKDDAVELEERMAAVRLQKRSVDGQIRDEEARIDRSQAHRADLQTQIEALESEKEGAVRRKEYKKAGRAAKQIKVLRGKSETERERIDTAKSAIATLTKDLEDQTTAMNDVAASISTFEEACDQKRFVYYTAARNEIIPILQRLGTVDEAEQKLLEQELEHVTGELQQLADTYGWGVVEYREMSNATAEELTVLQQQLQEKLELLEDAVQEEDFELAANLQERVDALRIRVKNRQQWLSPCPDPVSDDSESEEVVEAESGAEAEEAAEVEETIESEESSREKEDGPVDDEVIKANIAQMEEDLSAAGNQRDRLEAELADALEEEDYDLADALQSEIDGLGVTMEQLEVHLDRLYSSMTQDVHNEAEEDDSSHS